MSARDDIFKKINASVKKQALIAKDLSKEKTIANWASELFTELESTKLIDSDGTFAYLALHQFQTNLRKIDYKCQVYIKEQKSDNPRVEIHWSRQYITKNDCEEVTVLDASTAYFQAAMEDIK